VGPERRLSRWVLVIAPAFALVAATAAVAGASYDTRHRADQVARRAAQMVGITFGSNGRAPVVTPTPGFRVLGPTYLPSGLDVRSTSYSPGHTAGHTGSGVATFTVGPPGASDTPTPDLLQRITQSGLPTVDDRFSASRGDGYVEIVQRRVGADDPAPIGDAVALGSTTGFIVEAGGQTTLTFLESGLRVQVITDLGRSEAIAIASSLR
jgi:hypothetical protein